MTSWLDDELATCDFRDRRLAKRFRTLVQQLSEGIGETIPMACQDWAGTKAAYRFFSNEKVGEAEILAGHFQATQERFRATSGTVLVLHDTTEFSFQREDPQTIGVTHRNYSKTSTGIPRIRVLCGMHMHSSLAVTTEGLPLGIAAVKFWTRKKFKGTNALKRKVHFTTIPIEKKESVRWRENLQTSTNLLGEPQRCVHVGDRESDIYEFFCAAAEAKTHFLVRICADRLTEDGDCTLSEQMKEVRLKGLHRIEVRDKQGNCSDATLEVRYQRLRLLPPLKKQDRYPELSLTVIYAQERDAPTGREPIVWKLLTDLPVHSKSEAIEKLTWYALRWKIETFHKILKSGCKVEESRLRTADRLVNLIAVFCILSWRIFWMTMLNRSSQTLPPDFVFSDVERQLLDHFVPDRPTSQPTNKSLSSYITKVAKLGGYLARASDSPPGNIVMWRGLSKLTDIVFGFYAAKLVGN
jgi:transposase-like protein/DDE family transposase